MSEKAKLGNKKWTQREPLNRLIAVIDIGSNSVRMVVFKGLRRNPTILFNERVLCGLGKQVSSLGKMGDEEMDCALSTLTRFSILCTDMKVDVVEAFATAAVRNASNGDEFVKTVRAQCGFKVNILSGKDEAKFSAMGVISAFPKATGIVGDLGGGSLELVNIENDEILDRVTLPLGPVSLLGDDKSLTASKLKYIDQILDGAEWLNDGKDKQFYMVGGAWRSLTRLYLKEDDYPLKILQGYSISTGKMIEFCDVISRKTPSEIERLSKISKRRIPLLPSAATIMSKVLAKTKSSEVVSSDNGIREGILYKKLNHKLRKQDPFIAACKDIADKTGRFPEHASKLMKWMDPIFNGEWDEDNRLRLAVCLLSDMGWQGHPDYRAEMVFEQIFHGRFTGIDHRGRAMVALALYINYGGPFKNGFAEPARKILSEDDQKKAVLIGGALRLGQRLTGGTSNPLKYTKLVADNAKVCLILPKEYADLGGRVVMGRLKALAKIMKLSDEIIVE